MKLTPSSVNGCWTKGFPHNSFTDVCSNKQWDTEKSNHIISVKLTKNKIFNSKANLLIWLGSYYLFDQDWSSFIHINVYNQRNLLLLTSKNLKCFTNTKVVWTSHLEVCLLPNLFFPFSEIKYFIYFVELRKLSISPI